MRSRTNTPELPAALEPRYRLVRRLGEGGSASVWLVEDRELERPAALKRISMEAQPEWKARFVEEARLTAQLVHPHVIQVYDHGVEGEQAYILYEYVEGDDLRVAAEAGPSPPDQVAQWGAQVAEALAAAHQGGVVHRDVKPANILRRSTGEVVLADFGLARSEGPRRVQTATGLVLGTVQYLAPELLQGEVARPSSDQYGLGATLFHLWTGDFVVRPGELQVLWNAAPEAFDARIESRIPAQPAGLRAVVRRLLRRDPGARFPSADQAAAALAGLASEPREPSSRRRGQPVAASAPTRRRRRRPDRGRGLGAAGPLGLVLAAAVGVVAWLAPRPGPSSAAAPPPPPTPHPEVAAAEAARVRALLERLRSDHPGRLGPMRHELGVHLVTNRALYLDPDLPGRWRHLLRALGSWMDACRAAPPEAAAGPGPRALFAEGVRAFAVHALKTLQLGENHVVSLAAGLGPGQVRQEGEGRMGLRYADLSQLARTWRSVEADTETFLHEQVERPGPALVTATVAALGEAHDSATRPRIFPFLAAHVLSPELPATLEAPLLDTFEHALLAPVRPGSTPCDARAAGIERLASRSLAAPPGSHLGGWRVGAVRGWLYLAAHCPDEEGYLARAREQVERLEAAPVPPRPLSRGAWELLLSDLLARRPEARELVARVARAVAEEP